jgi:hypothetical protein
MCNLYKMTAVDACELAKTFGDSRMTVLAKGANWIALALWPQRPFKYCLAAPVAFTRVSVPPIFPS